MEDCEWPGKTFIQSAYRHKYYFIPAHRLEVQVVDVREDNGNRIQHLFSFFNSDDLKRTIDRRVTAVNSALQEAQDHHDENHPNTTTGVSSADQQSEAKEANIDTMNERQESETSLVR